MIVVRVTQCSMNIGFGVSCHPYQSLAVIPRIERYFGLLRRYWTMSKEQNRDVELNTIDELLLLVLQKLVRDGEIPHDQVKIISICDCQPVGRTERHCKLDKEGDFDDTEIQMHHGFFPQRLALLR